MPDPDTLSPSDQDPAEGVRGPSEVPAPAGPPAGGHLGPAGDPAEGTDA